MCPLFHQQGIYQGVRVGDEELLPVALTIPELCMLLKTRVAVSRKMPVMSASSLWVSLKLILIPLAI